MNLMEAFFPQDARGPEPDWWTLPLDSDLFWEYWTAPTWNGEPGRCQATTQKRTPCQLPGKNRDHDRRVCSAHHPWKRRKDEIQALQNIRETLALTDDDDMRDYMLRCAEERDLPCLSQANYERAAPLLAALRHREKEAKPPMPQVTLYVVQTGPEGTIRGIFTDRGTAGQLRDCLAAQSPVMLYPITVETFTLNKPSEYRDR